MLASGQRLDSAGVAAAVGLSRYRVLARLRAAAEACVQAGGPAAAEARVYLRQEALPAPVELSPRRWRAGVIYRWAKRTKRLDPVTLLPVRKPAPGRPAGGPPALPRHRPSLAEQLAAYEGVELPADDEPLRRLLAAGYARFRARGLSAADARGSAAHLAVQSLRVLPVQAMKAMLLVALEQQRRSAVRRPPDVVAVQAALGRLTRVVERHVAAGGGDPELREALEQAREVVFGGAAMR
jgi:hypothetical protein